MSSQRSRQNVKRQNYVCTKCENYDCKDCVSKPSTSIESTSEESNLEHWIATLSDLDESFSTPVADSGSEGEKLTLVHI